MQSKSLETSHQHQRELDELLYSKFELKPSYIWFVNVSVISNLVTNYPQKSWQLTYYLPSSLCFYIWLTI